GGGAAGRPRRAAEPAPRSGCHRRRGAAATPAPGPRRDLVPVRGAMGGGYRYCRRRDCPAADDGCAHRRRLLELRRAAVLRGGECGRPDAHPAPMVRTEDPECRRRRGVPVAGVHPARDVGADHDGDPRCRRCGPCRRAPAAELAGHSRL
ncbi:MAG: Uncharacterized amino acid permease, GabP family, partial [uncultured Arthrobacter sp.]